MNTCKVHICNGRRWPFILIVYRDGWKAWEWSGVHICPLCGPGALGSRIWPSAGTPDFGSKQCSNGAFCSFSSKAQLTEVALGYLESLCTLPNSPGWLPLSDVVFSSYEGGVSTVGFRIRKHSRVSTKASHMVKYWRLMVTLVIYELALHSMTPKSANLQV